MITTHDDDRYLNYFNAKMDMDVNIPGGKRTGYGNAGILTPGQMLLSIFGCLIGTFLCDAGITSTLCALVDRWVKR